MTMAQEFEDVGSVDGDSASTDDLREVIQSLFSDENINLKTVLNAEQVVALATALAFAQEYNVTLIQKVALLFMQLKVSEKARGRVDMRSVLMSFLGRKSDDDLKEFNKLLQ
jgi:hypothetical protein